MLSPRPRRGSARRTRPHGTVDIDTSRSIRLEPPAHTDKETEKLFRAFVHTGRISALPRKYARRRVLLDHVARLFEPGRRYEEAEVNAILLQVYDDWAELRRALVDYGFLTREHSVYWRSGGTVEV